MGTVEVVVVVVVAGLVWVGLCSLVLDLVHMVVVDVVLGDTVAFSCSGWLVREALMDLGICGLGLGEIPDSRCPRLTTATPACVVPSLETLSWPQSNSLPSTSRYAMVASWCCSLLGGIVLLLEES